MWWQGKQMRRIFRQVDKKKNTAKHLNWDPADMAEGIFVCLEPAHLQMKGNCLQNLFISTSIVLYHFCMNVYDRNKVNVLQITIPLHQNTKWLPQSQSTYEKNKTQCFVSSVVYICPPFCCCSAFACRPWVHQVVQQHFSYYTIVELIGHNSKGDVNHCRLGQTVELRGFTHSVSDTNTQSQWKTVISL